MSADDNQQSDPDSVVETAKETTIEDLPREVLCPIMEFLPYKDRVPLVEVNSRWHSIIDEMLGRKLFVGKPCQFTPDNEERYRHHYVSLDNLPQIGVNTCYVGEIIDPVKTMSSIRYYWLKLREKFFGSDIPSFKYPHLLKNLYFDGPLPTQYFEALIKPVINLRRLDVHYSSLCCLELENVAFPALNSLETLNIWGHKMTQGMFTAFYSPRQILPNLFTMLNEERFKNVKNFAIEYPFDLKEDERLTDEVLRFIKDRKDTLKKFKVCINMFVIEEPAEFDTVQDREWIQKAKATSKQLKLKEAEVIITSIYKVRMTKIWLGFLEAQTSLQSVMIMTFKLLPDILYRLCENNFRTLDKLGLSRLTLNNNGRFIPIDCSVFRNCLNLKYLFLEGMPTGLQSPGLTSTQFLPPSLERIDIGSITLSSEDTHNLLCGQLVNLKEVNLSDVGHLNDVGITLATLNEVISQRRIRLISLYASIIGRDRIPEEGLTNQHPTNPLMLLPRPFGMLEIELGENGYYRNVPRELPTIVWDLEDVD